MIKLEKNFTPLCLCPDEEKRLTALYKTTGTRVWAAEEITSALKSTSNGKCAYCEARLGVESHYLEVDHFEHKDKYPDKVANWDNLIPACRRCNGTKRDHDVVSDPIINPYKDDPRVHFGFRNYRYRGLSNLGRMSIGVLDLNNSERAVKARFEIGEQVQENLLTCTERLEGFLASRTTVRRNRLVALMRSLLLECQPDAAYAATTAYVLHRDEAYKYLVDKMRSENIWDHELEELHQASLQLMLSEDV